MFPLFLTQSEWLRLLDGTLSSPFFARLPNGLSLSLSFSLSLFLSLSLSLTHTLVVRATPERSQSSIKSTLILKRFSYLVGTRRYAIMIKGSNSSQIWHFCRKLELYDHAKSGRICFTQSEWLRLLDGKISSPFFLRPPGCLKVASNRPWFVLALAAIPRLVVSKSKPSEMRICSHSDGWCVK